LRKARRSRSETSTAIGIFVFKTDGEAQSPDSEYAWVPRNAWATVTRWMARHEDLTHSRSLCAARYHLRIRRIKANATQRVPGRRSASYHQIHNSAASMMSNSTKPMPVQSTHGITKRSCNDRLFTPPRFPYERREDRTSSEGALLLVRSSLFRAAPVHQTSTAHACASEALRRAPPTRGVVVVQHPGYKCTAFRRG
jgi:hypothetical protein